MESVVKCLIMCDLVFTLVLDRYCASVSTHSLRYSIGEYDISVCVSRPMPSNRTRRLKHMVRVDRMWLQNEAGILFTFCRTDCGSDARRHQRHPAASTLRGASITVKPGKRMPACQRERPAVEIWHADLQHWCNGAIDRKRATIS